MNTNTNNVNDKNNNSNSNDYKKETNTDSINNVDNNETKTEKTGPAETEEEENKNEMSENITINMELVGDEEVSINVGEKYVDPGIVATDSNGNDVSDKIDINSNVDANKKGKYRVIYSYGKSIVIRRVIVE